MRNLLVLALIVLMIGGAFLGFNHFQNKSNNNGSQSETQSNATAKSSADAVVLDLSGKGLTKVDSSIYNKTSTTDLILSNNNIKTLPSQMGKMTNLVIFKIDHNILEGSLIGEIRHMSKLKQLDASYNNMTGMPAEIGQLRYLESLNYSYNDITGLPNELANLKNNLKVFNLTGNPLKPDQINKLKASLPNTNIIF